MLTKTIFNKSKNFFLNVNPNLPQAKGKLILSNKQEHAYCYLGNVLITNGFELNSNLRPPDAGYVFLNLYTIDNILYNSNQNMHVIYPIEVEIWNNILDIGTNETTTVKLTEFIYRLNDAKKLSILEIKELVEKYYDELEKEVKKKGLWINE